VRERERGVGRQVSRQSYLKLGYVLFGRDRGERQKKRDRGERQRERDRETYKQRDTETELTIKILSKAG
jgi:hypothetical protein